MYYLVGLDWRRESKDTYGLYSDGTNPYYNKLNGGIYSI